MSLRPWAGSFLHVEVVDGTALSNLLPWFGSLAVQGVIVWGLACGVWGLGFDSLGFRV